MSNSSKTIVGIVVVIIIIAAIWYGVSRESAPETETPIKVGVLADLSGDYASFFEGIPRGVEMAKEDLIEKVEFIVEDQKSCDSKETVTIMHKFISVDKVDVIIGGTCSNTTLAAAPIAESSKTIMISPASSAPSITNAGEYVFRTFISDTFRGGEVSKLVFYEMDKRRIAFINDSSNAAAEINKVSKDVVVSLGGVVIEENITKTDTDFRTQLTKIKEFNPDVLFMTITGAKQIGLMAKQAKELGLDVQLVVPVETVEDPISIEIAGDALEGLIYVVPGNPPQTQAYTEFKRRFTEKYEEQNISAFLAETYDAVMLGVRAVLASDGTKEDIKDKLYEVSKVYQGVSGNVAFDENGDVTKSVMFKVIRDGQFVPYEE